jgi:hypothetical protein
MSVYRHWRSFSNVGLYLKGAKATSLAQRKTEVICERKRKREREESFSFLACIEGSKLNATHVHGLMGFLVLLLSHLLGYRLLHAIGEFKRVVFDWKYVVVLSPFGPICCTLALLYQKN